MKTEKFNEKEEAYKLAVFLKHQYRIDEKEFDEIIKELFEARNVYKLAGMQTFFDNMLFRKEIKAYKYVALLKLNEFLEKVRKVRYYDMFREVRKAYKTLPNFEGDANDN